MVTKLDIPRTIFFQRSFKLTSRYKGREYSHSGILHTAFVDAAQLEINGSSDNVQINQKTAIMKHTQSQHGSLSAFAEIDWKMPLI